MKIKLIDLFSGCGGVTCGFAASGFFSPTLAIDSWNKAIEVHNIHNKRCNHLLKKLGAKSNNTNQDCLNHDQLLQTILSIVSLKDSVHIHASPPCQELSSMNTRRSDSTTLTKWTLDFLTQKIPKHWSWTIEQVSHPLVKTLFSSYTNLFFELIDMSQYGVSQSRKRYIASNVPLFNKLSEYKSISPIKNVIKIPKEAKYIANGNFTVRKWEEIPEKMTIRELNNTTIGYTMVGAPGWFIDKKMEAMRPFTLLECACLQTYPDNFFPMLISRFTKKDLMQMVANSVPPYFARILAMSIASFYK